MSSVWSLVRRSKPIPPTYKTTNWAAYEEALKRRGSLTIWLDTDMNWHSRPSGRRQFTDVQRRRDPDVPDHESVIRNGASANDRLRREPLTVDRSGLGCAGFQHHLPTPKDACGGHYVSWRARPPALPDRQHRPSRSRASETPASMAAPNDASGARSPSVLMSKRWTSARSRSRAATPGMHRCCLICSPRSRAIRKPAA